MIEFAVRRRMGSWIRFDNSAETGALEHVTKTTTGNRQDLNRSDGTRNNGNQKNETTTATDVCARLRRHTKGKVPTSAAAESRRLRVQEGVGGGC